jgi:hypothetical protein
MKSIDIASHFDTRDACNYSNLIGVDAQPSLVGILNIEPHKSSHPYSFVPRRRVTLDLHTSS